MKMRIGMVVGLLAGLICFDASVAHADGLVMGPKQLATAQQVTLSNKITIAKATHAEAFHRIRRLKGHTPQEYRKYRSQKPSVAAELKALGPGAGWAIINALVFEPLPKNDATQREWDALRQDMVVALGNLRMPEARPVLQQVFQSTSSDVGLVHAAAAGLGMLGDSQSRAVLLNALHSSGKTQEGALNGLRYVRDMGAVNAVAKVLRSSPSTVQFAARALGYQGSSWAWRTGNAGSAADEMPIRARCMEVLLQEYLRHSGEDREAITRALSMVQHPATIARIDAMLGSTVDAADKQALLDLRNRMRM